jgi:cAMP-specific phosphodiesterase 4
MAKYSIPDEKFIKFAWGCNYYYSRQKNPFHNFHHGVAVCHAANYF